MRPIAIASLALLCALASGVHAQSKWGGDAPPRNDPRPSPQGAGPSATVDLSALRVPAASIGADLDVIVDGNRVEVSRNQLAVADQGAIYITLRSKRNPGPAPTDGSFGTPAGTYRVRLNIAAPQGSPKPLPPGTVTLSLETRQGPNPAPSIVSGVGQPTVCDARAGAFQPCDVLISTGGGAGVMVKAAGSRGWVAVQSVQVFKEK